MHVRNRLNLKFFIPSSLFVTGCCLLFSQSRIEVYVIIGVYMATLVNLFLLLSAINKITEVATAPSPVDFSKFNLLLIFIGKMAVIFLALTIGVHFIEKRIIIPLLNYVFQIFILGASFRRAS